MGPAESSDTQSPAAADKKTLGGFLASQQQANPQISNKNAVPSWQDQIDWDQEAPQGEGASQQAAQTKDPATEANTATTPAVGQGWSDSVAPPAPPGVGFYAGPPDVAAPVSPNMQYGNAVPTWTDNLDWGSPTVSQSKDSNFRSEYEAAEKIGIELPQPTEIEIAPLSLEELQVNAAPVVGFGTFGSGSGKAGSPKETATDLPAGLPTGQIQPGVPDTEPAGAGQPNTQSHPQLALPTAALSRSSFLPPPLNSCVSEHLAQFRPTLPARRSRAAVRSYPALERPRGKWPPNKRPHYLVLCL